MARRAAEREPGDLTPRNELVLVGRVAAAAGERELASGDPVCTFRVIVDRPPPVRPGSGRAVLVDTLDCAAWGAGVRRVARGLQPGDVVEVVGALRRRFWRAGAGSASRCEVEVAGLRRLARAEPAPVAARPRRKATGPASGVESPLVPAEEVVQVS